MTHISPTSSTSPQAKVETQESQGKSWYDAIVGFIFGEEPASEVPGPLAEKKIVEIDPEALRKERAAKAPTPVDKPAPSAPVNPIAQPAARPNIVVTEKMRLVGKQRLERLSTRLATVKERLAALEKEGQLKESQISGLKEDLSKVEKSLNPSRKEPRRRKKQQELEKKVAGYNEQIASLGKELEVARSNSQASQKEKGLVTAALSSAQKVVDLLKNKQVAQEEFDNLEKAAASAELVLAKV